MHENAHGLGLSRAHSCGQSTEIDPLICPECGSEMRVIAIIEDPDEIRHILRHLIKIGRAPPGFDTSRLN